MKKNKRATAPKSGRVVKGVMGACITLKKGERLGDKRPAPSLKKPSRGERMEDD